MPVVFFLAEDPGSGKIIDGVFFTRLERLNEKRPRPPEETLLTKAGRARDQERCAREVCELWKLTLMDIDGSFFRFLWWLGLREPKWNDGPPSGIASDKWAERLRSLFALACYRLEPEGSESEPAPRLE